MAGFWAAWKEDEQAKKLALIIGFFAVLLLMGIYVNFQDNPQEQTRALIFLLMLIWAIIFGLLDWGSGQQTHRVIEYVQFGSIKRLLISGVAGLIAAVFVSGALFTSVPLNISLIIGTLNLSFIYIVFIAPYCEEKFFACAVAPTSYKLFGGVIGLIVVSLFFGFYHGFAYGWNYDLMAIAVVWRAVVLLGNQFFKSTGFSFAAHITNNYLAFVG